jgi:hypothetical protein
MRIFQLGKDLGQNDASHKSGKHSHLQNIGLLRQGIATARYEQKSIFYHEAEIHPVKKRNKEIYIFHSDV